MRELRHEGGRRDAPSGVRYSRLEGTDDIIRIKIKTLDNDSTWEVESEGSWTVRQLKDHVRAPHVPLHTYPRACCCAALVSNGTIGTPMLVCLLCLWLDDSCCVTCAAQGDKGPQREAHPSYSIGPHARGLSTTPHLRAMLPMSRLYCALPAENPAAPLTTLRLAPLPLLLTEPRSNGPAMSLSLYLCNVSFAYRTLTR